jgi:phospholipase C
MIGRLLRVGAAGLVASASGFLPGISSVANASTPGTPSTAIHHLVVMTQDQHSFDNYFGTRPGVDGLPTNVCVPVRQGSPTPCVKPFPLSTSTLHLPLESSTSTQLTSIDGGRMDGFVYSQNSHTNAGRMAMGYYLPQDVPVLNQLANNAVLFDHWFTSVPGGTIQNRLFAVSGQSTSDQLEVPPGGWTGIPLIFDRLQAAGVSWRVYVENYKPALNISTANATARRGGEVARVPVLATARFANNPQLAAHVVDLSQYYVDLATGNLPAVSYIVSTSSTERPPANPTAGQVLARNVANSLSESSAWKSSAFLLYYDSAGGWYDHVAPPKIDGAQLGPRVPALLISPYAAPGSVDHAVVDSASILKFIEYNWSLQPLTSRDAAAPNLTSAFSFAKAPRAPALIVPSDGRRPLIRPSSPIIYFAYTLALVVVGAAVAGTALSERRKRLRAISPVPPLPSARPMAFARRTEGWPET